jgi:hypothetical protein
MSHFRLTYEVISPKRVDIYVSVGKEKDAHHTPCGVLIMSIEQWEAFRSYLRPEIEIREDK